MRQGLRQGIVVLAAVTAALVVLVEQAAAAPPATARGITPTSVSGSSELNGCANALSGQVVTAGIKVESGSTVGFNGTWTESGNPLSVTISNAANNGPGGVSMFDWSANMRIDFVFVKVATGAHKYDYSSYPWVTNQWNDQGLVSAKDSISHILFCQVQGPATIQLKKEFLNAPSNNRANLFIKQGGNDIADDQGQKLDAANGEGTAVLSVLPGSFDLSETAGANTNFAKYTSTWDCTKNGAPFVASTPGTSGAVQVGAEENIVCTFHNSFNKTPTTVTTNAAVLHARRRRHRPDRTATLAGGDSPTGTITFHLFSDQNCSTEVAGSPVTTPVNGNGQYVSPRRST